MAFDGGQHATAQRYFAEAVKLAAEAGDPPMAAHVLRAMAHQAIDLGHHQQALNLAAASVDGDRYTLASPRERALLGVVHARSLAAAGRKNAAAKALLRAEDDLSAASDDIAEPDRVFFFGEASLAHETACALRDIGDLDGSVREFHHSVRTRKATKFTRTHAVTLGYLGSVYAQMNNIDRACATWSQALDAMDGVRSGRTRQAAADMRTLLSPTGGAVPRRSARSTHALPRTCPKQPDEESLMADRETFEVEALGHVVGGRIEPTDDFWGGTRVIIRLDGSLFTADATKGLEDFSHLEIVFRFHLTDPTDLNLGARRPRDNPEWPEVGIFGHRNMRRLNWLGVSRCRLIKVDGLDLHVEDLDAVDGTPVLDVKPWFGEMGPRGEQHQAEWTTVMLRDYFAPVAND